MNLAPYRKAVIAVVAALVTVGQAFGWPVTDELGKEVVAVFDAVAAVLVYWVPNG